MITLLTTWRRQFSGLVCCLLMFALWTGTVVYIFVSILFRAQSDRKLIFVKQTHEGLLKTLFFFSFIYKFVTITFIKAKNPFVDDPCPWPENTSGRSSGVPRWWLGEEVRRAFSQHIHHGPCRHWSNIKNIFKRSSLVFHFPNHRLSRGWECTFPSQVEWVCLSEFWINTGPEWYLYQLTFLKQKTVC